MSSSVAFCSTYYPTASTVSATAASSAIATDKKNRNAVANLGMASPRDRTTKGLPRPLRATDRHLPPSMPRLPLRSHDWSRSAASHGVHTFNLEGYFMSPPNSQPLSLQTWPRQVRGELSLKCTPGVRHVSRHTSGHRGRRSLSRYSPRRSARIHAAPAIAKVSAFSLQFV
jgi:hypothetical protein